MQVTSNSRYKSASRESECEHLWFEPPNDDHPQGSRGFPRACGGSEAKPRGASRRIRESAREREEEPVEVFWRQSGGFPVELEGKKEPGAPGASGIPQQEVGRPRSGQEEAAWSGMECLKEEKQNSSS